LKIPASQLDRSSAFQAGDCFFIFSRKSLSYGYGDIAFQAELLCYKQTQYIFLSNIKLEKPNFHNRRIEVQKDSNQEILFLVRRSQEATPNEGLKSLVARIYNPKQPFCYPARIFHVASL
jgi:hypothetical protein